MFLFGKSKINSKCNIEWYIPVIPALGRLRQKDHSLKVSVGCLERCCHKQISKFSQCSKLFLAQVVMLLGVPYSRTYNQGTSLKTISVPGASGSRL
jgi:hypothetical protein